MNVTHSLTGTMSDTPPPPITRRAVEPFPSPPALAHHDSCTPISMERSWQQLADHQCLRAITNDNPMIDKLLRIDVTARRSIVVTCTASGNQCPHGLP